MQRILGLFEEELRQIGTDQITRCNASEQGGRSYLAVCLWSTKIRAGSLLANLVCLLAALGWRQRSPSRLSRKIVYTW